MNKLELKKRFFLALLCVSLAVPSVFAAQTSADAFRLGVEKYRQGETLECLEIMQSLKKKDASNAYVLYYLAMSNAKLGNVDEAKKNYERVILLNSDQELVSYAKEGILNIDRAMAKEGMTPAKPKLKDVFADKPPAALNEPSKTSSKNNVSDDDVAKAIRTLKEAGLLNVQLGVGANSASPASMLPQSNDLMNMGLMMSSMGGSKGSSGMDMLPFLMMQQSTGANGAKSAISPEVIQMMMNNSMLDGLSAFDMNNKDK